MKLVIKIHILVLLILATNSYFRVVFRVFWFRIIFRYSKYHPTRSIRILLHLGSDTDLSFLVRILGSVTNVMSMLTLYINSSSWIGSRMDGEALKSYVSHWPAQRWQEYEPLLTYCRDNSVKLIACGTPLKVIYYYKDVLENIYITIKMVVAFLRICIFHTHVINLMQVLRTVQAEGIRGLSESERRLYTPPAGSGFISGFTPFSRSSSLNMNPLTQIVPFGPSSYLSAQARVVEDHTMSQVILQAVADGGGTGLLLVVTGANHVEYGSRGTGLPARVSRKIPKKSQLVVLLDPERQFLRKEGESPVADFLWYSAARPCSRNCFDRAEIARVMNAAGRSRDALPQVEFL